MGYQQLTATSVARTRVSLIRSTKNPTLYADDDDTRSDRSTVTIDSGLVRGERMQSTGGVLSRGHTRPGLHAKRAIGESRRFIMGLSWLNIEAWLLFAEVLCHFFLKSRRSVCARRIRITVGTEAGMYICGRQHNIDELSDCQILSTQPKDVDDIYVLLVACFTNN
jgi:hypothetical protein